jgi:predicted PurR-regulated permease PerM
MRSETSCAQCGARTGAPERLPLSPLPGARWARLWAAAESRAIPLRTIIAAIAALAVIYLGGELVFRLRGIVVLLAASGFIALILDPLVAGVQRRIVPRRGTAVAIVGVSAFLIFAGFAAGFGYPMATAITHLTDKLPGYVTSAERGRGWAGHLLRRYHLQTWVQRNAPELASVVQRSGRPALAAGKNAMTLAATLVTVFSLALLLLLEGPKLRAWTLARMPPERGARYVEVAAEVRRSVVGYAIGNLLTSAIAGTVVFVALLSVGVPFAPFWGLWVGLVDFLPIIGGALAGLPTVLFAFSHSVAAGIVTLAVFVVYTQIENHVLNPLVMSRTVKISPLLVLLSVLAGYSIGAWIGGLFGIFVACMLAVPGAAAIQILAREVWRGLPRVILHRV